MANEFNKKTVVITGGGSGIGKSLAEQLRDSGADVIVIGRSERPQGYTGEYIQADMTDSSLVDRVFNTIATEHRHIDYVFNCAGIFMAGEIRDTPIEDWKKVVDNNIWAVNNGTHFAYQIMLKQGSGHIINVASAAGLFPVPAMSIYGSSKFAIVGLTHALRNEAKSFNIRASVVCPTVVNTPLYDTALYNKVNAPKALISRGTLQTPEVAAKRIINGVKKNKATIHTAFSTRLAWFAYKYVPGIYNVFAQRAIVEYRKKLRIE